MAERSILIKFLGNSDGLKKGGKEAEQSVNSLKEATEKFGRTLATVYAAKEIIEFGKHAVEAAVKDEAAQAILKQALIDNTGATNDQVEAVDKWIKKMAEATGVSKDDLRPALGTLLTVTKDTGKAQDLMGLSMDIARAKGIPLEKAATALAKAYAGNMVALNKLVPGIKHAGETTIDFATAKDRLNAAFGGTQSAWADTTEGKMARLSIQWKDMQETIGQKLIPVLGELVGIISSVFDWFNNLNGTQQGIILGVLGIAAAVYVGVSAWTALSAAATVFGLSMEVAMPWLIGVGVAVAAVTVVVGLFGDSQSDADKKAKAFGESVRGAAAHIDAQALSLLSARDAATQYGAALYADLEQKTEDAISKSAGLTHALNETGISMADIKTASHDGAVGIDLYAKVTQYARDNHIDLTDKLNIESVQLAALRDMILGNVDAGEKAAQQNVALAKTGSVVAIEALKAGGEFWRLTAAEQAAANAALAASGAHDAAGQSVAAEADAMASLTDAHGKQLTVGQALIDLQAKLSAQYKETTTAITDLYKAERSAADAGYAVADATDKYHTFLDELAKKLEAAKGDQDQINALYRQGTTDAAGMADATVRVFEETSKANGVTLTATQSHQIWNQTMLQSAITANGPLRDSILAYIATANGIPPEKVTEIKADLALGALDAANKALDGASADRVATIVATADTTQAQAALDSLVTSRSWKAVISGSAGANGVRALAGGTNFWPGGPALINDGPAGGEIVVLPTGTMVIPGDKTDRILSGSGGGSGGGNAPIVVQFVVNNKVVQELKVATDRMVRGAL